VVLHDVVEEGLQVEEDSQCLRGDAFDIVELFVAVLFDVVGAVDGETLVVVRYVAHLPRNQVQPQQEIARLALEVLQGRVLVHQ
jgi:hypothetical protein